MSKRRRNRPMSRRAKKQAQQKQLMTYGIVAVVIIGIFGLIAVSGGLSSSSGPDVAQERLDLDPIMGDPNAPVTLIEYGAYACPACRQFHQSRTIEQLLEEFDGQINFTFRDFPVISPAYDNMAANIAQCVLDQGEDQFWSFHDMLYTGATPGRSSEDDLIRMAVQVGANDAELQTCVDEDTHRQTVRYDEQRAFELGLSGTPSIVINGQRIFNLSIDTLRSAINSALDS